MLTVSTGICPLTKRELQVASMLELSNKEIGTTLEISERTTKSHITQIMEKVETRSRTAIVVKCLRNGWLTL